MLEPQALLLEVARTLRGEVGPATAGDYARTQAFMAAVVLEKLAGQLAADAADRQADADDVGALASALHADLGQRRDPAGMAGMAGVAVAVAALADGPPAAALGVLVRALHSVPAGSVDHPLAVAMLARTRAVLRRLDRQLAYSA